MDLEMMKSIYALLLSISMACHSTCFGCPLLNTGTRNIDNVTQFHMIL